VAGRLKESVQDKDTVSRQSGDEFAILINDCGNVSMVAMIAERLLASIRRPLLLDGHDIALSACIGISIYPEDGDDVDALLKNADTALHAAKAVGRDSYRFFEAEMNNVIGERLRLDMTCARLWPSANCSSITSRNTMPVMGACWVWRPCCAGAIRSMA
jgi:predicted signal transduction protein with EAL and GGDEF domain